ncbi:hypothetical protein [Clostridium sp. K25]|nr:hypothetical protein [Clostridium sp. K25]
MSRFLNIEVLKILSIDNIKFKCYEDSKQVYMYLNAIGALIRE